ncbi:hypothetical protein CYLTODRAFT_487555 [Cylindrobasidium torrendii FP15055 ss-10]|uniref:Uncharacterized protein n=1 Tax=Cylindrobasidium torrendii FP15055 ss-10 TaxID=1314674 RepID=A0A0D7BLN0_9AGAR|nr:hypothetical protein CYLTODRAFT_487555 [Cylindrobasidium torrendii FP15055 ss-10]
MTYYVLVFPPGCSYERRAGVYRTMSFIPNGWRGNPFPMQFGPFDTNEQAQTFFRVLQPAVVAHHSILASGGTPDQFVEALESGGAFSRAQEAIGSLWYFSVVYGHRVVMHFTDADTRQNLAGSRGQFRQAGVFDTFQGAFRYLLTRGASETGRREWSPDLSSEAAHTPAARTVAWNPSPNDVPYVNPADEVAQLSGGQSGGSSSQSGGGNSQSGGSSSQSGSGSGVPSAHASPTGRIPPPVCANASPTRQSTTTTPSAIRTGSREETESEEAALIVQAVQARLAAGINFASSSGLGPFPVSLSAQNTPQSSPSRTRLQMSPPRTRPQSSPSRARVGSDSFTMFLAAYHSDLRVPIERALQEAHTLSMFLNAAHDGGWMVDGAQLNYIWDLFGDTLGHPVAPTEDAEAQQASQPEEDEEWNDLRD